METKITKVPISVESDAALDRMLNELNSDFPAGKIRKHDLANWLIAHFERDSFSKSVEQIRKTFFDETAYLEFVLRELKKSKNAGGYGEITTLLTPLTERLSARKEPNLE